MADGTLLEGSGHGRDGGTVDIRIQNGDPRPLFLQCQRQVDGGGGLAHPALAGGDHDDVANALHRRQPLRPRHAGHLDLADPVDTGRAGDAAQPGIEVLLDLLEQGMASEGQHQLNGERRTLFVDAAHEAGSHQILAPPCRLKFGQDLFY